MVFIFSVVVGYWLFPQRHRELIEDFRYSKATDLNEEQWSCRSNALVQTLKDDLYSLSSGPNWFPPILSR